MKKMNKEEIIEYFIKQLGDNEVLGKYFSIEEIRARLNQNIKEVTYQQEEGNVGGHYDCKTKIINIDWGEGKSELEKRENIVHELIHALSFSESKDESNKIYKCGFQLSELISDDKMYCSGISINEGITQLLTEQILGIDTNMSPGYELEKDVTRIMFSVLGKEEMLEFYFADVKNQQEVFRRQRDILYLEGGNTNFPNSVKQNLKELFRLSEQLAIMKYNAQGVFTNDQFVAYNKVREQLCAYVGDLVKEVLNSSNQSDNPKRRQQILEAVVNFHEIHMKLNTEELAGELAKIIFESEKTTKLGSKIYQFKELTGRDTWYSKSGMDYRQIGEYIEEQCLANGIISVSNFSKSGMLSCIFNCYGELLKNIGNGDLRRILSNFSYTKAGDLYELHYHGIVGSVRGGTNAIWFEKNGDYPKDIYGFSFSDGELYENGEIPTKIDRQDVQNIKKEIKRIAAESDKEFTRVMVLGKDVIMYYRREGTWSEDNRIVYSVNDKGDLVPSQEEHRRLTDDMDEDKFDRGTDRVMNSLWGYDITKAKKILNNYLEVENQGITFEDIVTLMKRLRFYPELREVAFEKLQKFFISKVDFSKRDMLEKIICLGKYVEMDWSKCYYQKVGSHYELVYKGNLNANEEETKRKLGSYAVKYYDKEGKSIIPTDITGRADEDEEIDTHLLDEIKKVNEENGKVFSQIYKIGNDIIFEQVLDEGTVSVTYSLNEKGELELATSLEPRRITDDMSELDIQIMEETVNEDVSIKEMLEMADKVRQGLVSETGPKENVEGR